jgi:hypothetical protein
MVYIPPIWVAAGEVVRHKETGKKVVVLGCRLGPSKDTSLVQTCLATGSPLVAHHMDQFLKRYEPSGERRVPVWARPMPNLLDDYMLKEEE